MNTATPSSAELRRRAAIVEHYEKGGKVEYSYRHMMPDAWCRTPTPRWYWDDYDYRPYVEPPKPIEGWVFKRPDGTGSGLLFSSEIDCKQWYIGGNVAGRAVLMREVVE